MTPQETRKKAQTYFNTFLDLWEQGADVYSINLSCLYDYEGKKFYPLSIRFNDGEFHNVHITEEDYAFSNEELAEIVKKLQSQISK